MKSSAQVISLTPQSNTIEITSNTTITLGSSGFKTYLVCPGVTLFYTESSTMDSIILLSGSTLVIDSAFSYGYAIVYAQSGSTVDMNFRQTGSLNYESGVTILDTTVFPPSFFQGSQQVNTIQISYANLSGGASACTPLNIQDIDTQNESVHVNVEGNNLNIKTINTSPKYYCIINAQGQKVKQFQSKNNIITEDISLLPNGIYWLKWISNSAQDVISFWK